MRGRQGREAGVCVTMVVCFLKYMEMFGARPMKEPACSMTPNQVGLGPGQLCPRKMRLLLAAGSMGMLRPANDILAENDFSKDRYRGLQSHRETRRDML